MANAAHAGILVVSLEVLAKILGIDAAGGIIIAVQADSTNPLQLLTLLVQHPDAPPTRDWEQYPICESIQTVKYCEHGGIIGSETHLSFSKRLT